MRTLCLLVLGVAAVLAQPAGDRLRWLPTGGPGTAVDLVFAREQDLVLVRREAWLRSRDGGHSWESPPPPPQLPWTVASDGHHLFGDVFNEIHRSDDFGDSWTPCGPLPIDRGAGNTVRSVAADAQQVYAAIDRRGLFRSADRCASWTGVATPGVSDLLTILLVDGSRIAIREGGYTFVSGDRGATWIRPDVLPVALAAECDGALLAGAFGGVHRSRDNGHSWVIVGLEGRAVRAVFAPTCHELFAIVEEDPATRTLVVVRSTDEGRTWDAAMHGLAGHAVSRFSRDEQGTLYGAGDSVFRWSADSGWTRIGPDDAHVSSLLATPWGDLLAETFSGLFRRAANSGSWEKLTVWHQPDGSAVPVRPSLWTLALTGDERSLLPEGQTADRGRTWDRRDLVGEPRHMLLLPDGVIFAGTRNGVIRSTDGGQRWVERSFGLPTVDVLSLAGGPDVLYAGTREGGVFYSTDQAERWRPLGPQGLPGGWVRALLALPSGDLFAGSTRGLFRWRASSRTWASVRLPASRPSAVVRALLDAGGALFAATDGDGVFASLDQGVSWSAVNDGLPDHRVLSLALDAGGHLAAGTMSAGVYRTAAPVARASSADSVSLTSAQRLASAPVRAPSTEIVLPGGGSPTPQLPGGTSIESIASTSTVASRASSRRPSCSSSALKMSGRSGGAPAPQANARTHSTFSRSPVSSTMSRST